MRNHEMILRIVALALLLYALGSFAASELRLRQTEAETSALEQRLLRLREENAELHTALDRAGSEEEILRRARERLGLVLPYWQHLSGLGWPFCYRCMHPRRC